jgi:membrane-associated phospholipid phosphatase
VRVLAMRTYGRNQCFRRQDRVRAAGWNPGRWIELGGHDEHSTDISDFRVDTGVRLLQRRRRRVEPAQSWPQTGRKLRPASIAGASPSAGAASTAAKAAPAQQCDRGVHGEPAAPPTDAVTAATSSDRAHGVSKAAGGRRRLPPRRSTLLGTAAICTAAFVVLSWLVAEGITQDFDDAVRWWFRPNDVWGVYQLIFGNVVDGLAPRVALALLVIASGAAAWRVRSVRPIVFAGLTASVAALLTVVSKATFQRPDPHGGISGHGGAYPSGHMVMLLVAVGCALLMLRPRARWWEWIGVAVVGLTMAVSLLLLAMHWFTDVAAGTLIGIALLAVVSIPGVARAAPKPNVESGTAERDVGVS